MSKLVTDPDDILRALLDDPAFTESAYKDEIGVYLLSGDGEERRYITQLQMEEGPLPEEPPTTEQSHE